MRPPPHATPSLRAARNLAASLTRPLPAWANLNLTASTPLLRALGAGTGRHFLLAGTDWPRPALFEARRSWQGILSRWRMSRETRERRTTRKHERSIPRSVCAPRLTCLWRVQGEYA